MRTRLRIILSAAHSRLRRGLFGGTSIAVLMVLAASTMSAATYTVTTTADTNAVGTLRYAITQANANPGSTITFNNNLGTITLGSELPFITASVTINGGTGNTVDGNNTYRIFWINAGTVSISNLTLANGRAKGGDGGANNAAPGGGGMGAGGGVFVRSGVTLSGVTFIHDQAVGGAGGGVGTVQPITINPADGGGGLGGNGAGNIPFTEFNGLGSGGGGGAHVSDVGGTPYTIFPRYWGGPGGGPNGGAGGYYENSPGEPQAGPVFGGDLSGGGGDPPFENPSLQIYYPGAAGGFGGGGGGGIEFGAGLFGEKGGDGGFGAGGGGGFYGSPFGSNGLPVDTNPGGGGHGGFGGGGGGGLADYNNVFPSIASFGGFGGGNGGEDPTFGPAGAGGGAGFGGAIFVANGGSLTLVNPAFSNNAVQGGAGGNNYSSGSGTNGAALAPDLFLNGVIPTIQVDSGQTLTLSNAICGAGNSLGSDANLADANSGFTKTGAGTLTLAVANQIGGTVTVAGGTLVPQVAGALGQGPINVTGGTLVQGAAGIFGPGALSLTSGGVVDFNGLNTTMPSLSGTGGLLVNNGGGAVTLTFSNAAANSVYGGSIVDHQTGNGTLGLGVSAGTLTLTGNSSFTGGIALSGTGLLKAGYLGLGTAPVTLSGNAALHVIQSSAGVLSNGVTLAMGPINGSSGIVSSDPTYAGLLSIGNGGGNGSFGGTIQNADAGHNLALQKDGSGTQILSGTNTYTGITRIFGGTLQALYPASLPNPTSVQVAAGATVAVNVGGANEWTSSSITSLVNDGYLFGLTAAVALDTTDGPFTYGDALAGKEGFTKLGLNTLTLTGAHTYTGTTLISAGTLQVGAGGTTGNLGTGPVVNNAALVFNRSDALVASTNISGTGSVTLTGGGAFTLSGTNTYTGGTFVTAGSLIAGASSLPATGGLTLSNGATLALKVGGANDWTAAAIDAFRAGGSLSAGSAFGLDTSDGAFTYGLNLTGALGLTKLGANMLILTGDNTYSGATVISAGALQVGNNGISGTLGVGTVTDNASLIFNRTDNIVVPNSIGGSGSVSQIGTGVVTLAGTNTYAGQTLVSAGALVARYPASFPNLTNFSAATGTTVGAGVGGAGEWTVAGLDNLSASSIFNSGAALGIDTTDGTFTYPSTIGGSLSLNKLGANSLILTGGTNTNSSGTITISAGTLQIGNGGTSGEFGGGAVVNNATLVFNRSDPTGTGRTISGTGSVVFAGTGQFVLANPTTYTGGTVVNPGANLFLYVNAPPPNNINTAPIVGPATNNGTLTYYVDNDNQGYGITSVPISGTGALTTDGSGDFSANNASTYTGGTTIMAGTFYSANHVVGDINGALTVNGGTFSTLVDAYIGALKGSGGIVASTAYQARLYVGNGNANGSFGGSIRNYVGGYFAQTIGLTKVGTGTEVLTGSNTYGAGTQVNGGTLQAKFPGSLPNFGNVSVANGATMAVNVGGASEWIASDVDSLRGSASFSAGSALGIDTTDGDFTYGSSFGGSLGLTKLGSNTLTLTGTTSYTGPTVVVAGTLLFTNGASLGAVAVNPGATLMVTGGTFAASGGVINSGTIRIEHGAVLSVPGGSSFVNSGLLDLISGSFTPPNDFVNNGVVLDSSLVKTKSVALTGGGLSVLIDSYSGHTYQLQRSAALTSGYTNLGSPQTGATGTTLTFTDSAPPVGSGFYRVAVDP